MCCQKRGSSVFVDGDSVTLPATFLWVDNVSDCVAVIPGYVDGMENL